MWVIFIGAKVELAGQAKLGGHVRCHSSELANREMVGIEQHVEIAQALAVRIIATAWTTRHPVDAGPW